MSLLSMAIACTLNDPTVWVLAGALVGVYIAEPVLRMTHHGTDARTLLASAGGVITLIFARFALAPRRHLKTVWGRKAMPLISRPHQIFHATSRDAARLGCARPRPQRQRAVALETPGQRVEESDRVAHSPVIRQLDDGLPVAYVGSVRIHHAPCSTDPAVMALDTADEFKLNPRIVLMEAHGGCHHIVPSMRFKRRIKNLGVLSERLVGKLSQLRLVRRAPHRHVRVECLIGCPHRSLSQTVSATSCGSVCR